MADIAMYGYVHAAPDAGVRPGSATQAWIRRVEAQPGHVNDLAPYPPAAMAGAGGAGLHG